MQIARLSPSLDNTPPVSFIMSTFSKFQAAFEFPTEMMEFIEKVICDFYKSPCDLALCPKFMRNWSLKLNTLLKGSSLLDKEGKRLARISLKACFVLLTFEFHETMNNTNLLYSVYDFCAYYEEYAGELELDVLVRVRNYMAVSLTLLEAENNKTKHLEIAQRLSEGKYARYVTGSGQTDATTRRVRIYERESNTKPKTAEQRKRKRSADCDTDCASTSDDGSAGKKSHTDFSGASGSINDDSSVSSHDSMGTDDLYKAVAKLDISGRKKVRATRAPKKTSAKQISHSDDASISSLELDICGDFDFANLDWFPFAVEDEQALLSSDFTVSARAYAQAAAVAEDEFDSFDFDMDFLDEL